MQPGETIDRYTIEAQLGEGGMGVVFRAHDMRLSRKVALKVLRVGEGKAAAAAARLLREARNVASFEHPNAVTIFDVGEVDGSPYIAMELINGKTLRDVIGSSVPWAQRVLWLVDAGRALAAAHKIGLVHRDVKPENIMVREDGCVKVLDFGIARKVQQHAVPAPPTASDVPKPATPPAAQPGGPKKAMKGVVGTPLYLCAERLRGKPADGRSDQFSWGVSAFHVLAGKSPWGEPQNQFELMSTIMFAEPLSLSALAPDVPVPVVRVIERAMARQPEDRFASMDEAVDALEQAVGPARGRLPSRSFEDAATPPTDAAPSPSPVVVPLLPEPPAPGATPAATAPRNRWGVAAFVALAFGVGLLVPRPWAVRHGTTEAGPSALLAGQRALEEGRDDLALRQLSRARDASPDQPAPHVWLALVAWLHGQDPAADLDAARRASAALDPTDAHLLTALSACAGRDTAACDSGATAAAASAPDQAILALVASVAAERAGREALTAAVRATDLDPSLVPAWRQRVHLAK